MKITDLSKLKNYGFKNSYANTWYKSIKTDGIGDIEFIVNPVGCCDDRMVINYCYDDDENYSHDEIDEYITEFDFIFKMFEDGVLIYDNN